MADRGAYIAVDWGTTNRRAYLVGADGSVGDTMQDDRGVLALSQGDYAAEIAALRARFGDRDILAAGMIGSNRGWHEVEYVAAPAGLMTLAEATVEVAPRTWIVPGVALRGGARADVMRGEEVQVLGAIAAGLAPADAAFCQPGTHNKWIDTRSGTILDFATTMTGELFALLRQHGILAGMLDGAVADGPAFRAGLERGSGATDLTVALFEVRARVLVKTLDPAEAAAYASGILIGADVGARGDLSGRGVHLLAGGSLAALYAVAIAAHGGEAITIDNEAAFVAGVHAIRDHIA